MPYHAHFEGYGHPIPHGKLPPFRFWVQKNLPSLYDDSLSYYDLLTRVTWYIDQIVNTMKVYDDQFCEIMGVYNELEKYVNSYFDCLDVPEIVKTILDDMAATGRLSEILVGEIKDFSIDVKKIKNGIVPLHYTYSETVGGNEYYTRAETDSEVVDILRNGSVVMGVFQGSPCYGTFVLLQKSASYIYEGGYEREFECGCVNTVYTKDFNIYYDDFLLMTPAGSDVPFIMHRVVTDLYTDDKAMLTLENVYANIPDGYVTTAKIADKAVTEPKLADPVAAKLNITYTLTKTDDKIKLVDSTGADCGEVTDSDTDTIFTLEDGAVTIPKLHADVPAFVRSNNPSKYIFIGDSYAARQNSWITEVKNIMGLEEGVNCWTSSSDGAGFTAGTTFQSQLETLLNSLTPEQCDQITDVVVLGGWNDGSRNVTTELGTFLSKGNAKLQFAKYHLGYISWEDSGVTGGNKLSRIQGCQNYIEAANAYGICYIGNIQYVMHDYSLFAADGIHLNSDGAYAIAGALATYLRGGQVDVVKTFRVDQNVQWDSNVTPADNTKIVSTWLDNNICGFFTSHTHYNFTTAVDFSGHPSSDAHGQGWTKLFDLGDPPFIQDSGFHGFNECVNVTLYNGSYWEDYPCWIQLRGHGFYMCPISANGEPDSNPYKPIEGIEEAIFQVGSLTLDGWSMYG